MTVSLEIAIVAAAAIVVAVCVARLAHRAPPRATREPPRPVVQADQLLRLERMIGGARHSALHVHAYLRPELAEIASCRLAARGRALERMSDRQGRELLGDGLWEIVRPDRPFPSDRYGPGVSLQELDAILTVLERL